MVGNDRDRSQRRVARHAGRPRHPDPLRAATRLNELRDGLLKVNQGYWAEQVEVQILAARAWLAQGQGNPDEALKLMAAAADLEDSTEKHVAMESRLGLAGFPALALAEATEENPGASDLDPD